MGAKAEMALILSLVDEVTKTAKDVKKELDETGKKSKETQGLLSKLGKGAGIAVGAGFALASAAAVALGKAAWDAGMQYDDAMDTIAISTGATGDELAALGGDFRAVFTSIPIDAATASGVISELNRTLGVSGDTLVDIARPLAEASRMMGTDATASAQGFAQAMNAWKVDAADAPATLDALFVATQKSGVGFDELLTNLSTFGPALQTMGFSLTESTALLAELEKAGMPATNAMTALQFAAKTFTKDGVPLQEGLAGIIASITEAASTEEALALGMKTFGSRAALPMVEAIRSGKMNLDEMTAALKGSEGAIMDTAAATADFPEKLQVMKNVVTDALAPIGLGIMDIVTKLVVQLMPAFEKLAAWVTEHLAPAMELFGEAVTIALSGDFQGALEHLFGEETAAKIMGVLDAAKTTYQWIDQAIRDVREWVSGAVAFITGLWQKHGDDVTTSVTGTWATIRDGFMAGVGAVKEFVETALATIRGWWSEHGETVMEIVRLFWDGIKLRFQIVIDLISGIFKAFKLAFEGDWYGFGETLRETAVKTWDNIKAIFVNFKDSLLAIWNLVKDDVIRVWDSIRAWFGELPGEIIAFFTDTDWGQVGQNILQGIANGLKAGLDWLRDAARGVAQAALDAMKGLLGIHSPSRVAELQVGLPLGQGIIEGLRAATPGLLAASRGMVDNTIGAMSGITGGYTLQNAQPQLGAASFGGRIEGYSQEALAQMFEVLARAVTMPLGRVFGGQLRGESESEMGSTLRALSFAG